MSGKPSKVGIISIAKQVKIRVERKLREMAEICSSLRVATIQK